MPNIGTTSRLAFIVSLDNSNFLRNSEILEKKLASFGVAASRFGQGLTRSLSLITGILEGFAVAAASTFDEIASQLQAVSGGQGFEQLIDNARQLGRSTKFTATEVLTLTRELKKLGLSTDDVVSGVEKTIDVVTVFGGDLVNVGDAIAGLTRQFTDLTFARAADVLSVAFRKTALGADNFREAFKNVGAVANLTGLSFEKTVAVLGGLANAAQRGGIGGNRFKTVLAKLAENGYDAADGLLAIQAGGNEFSTLLEFFKQRGVIAAGSIQELGLEIEELTLLLGDADGASGAFANAMREKLFFQVARAKAAVEDLGISLGYALKPVITKVADVLEYLSDKFAQMSSEEAQALAGNALFVIALGPLIFALGQLAIAVTAILTPIGLLVSTLFIFAAAFVRAATKTLLLDQSIASSKKVLEDFNDELEKVDGNLSELSTAQLEGQLSSLKGRLNKSGLTEDVQTILEFGQGLTYFERQIANSQILDEDSGLFYEFRKGILGPFASLLGLDFADAQALLQKLEAAKVVNKDITDAIAAIVAELEKREADRARIAAENLAIARELGLLGAEDLKPNQDLFAETIEKLKGAVAAFAVEAGKAKLAINDLNQLDLATFEQAMIGKFPQLLDEFGFIQQALDVGKLEDLNASAEGLKETEKVFRSAAEQFLKLKNQKLADFFIRLADGYEKLAKAVEQAQLVEKLSKAGKEVATLNEELQSLGRQGLGDTLKAKLSDATKQLNELLSIDPGDRTDSTIDRINELTDGVENLERQIAQLEVGKSLGDILFGKGAEDFGSDLLSPFETNTTGPISDNIRNITNEIEKLRENLALAKTLGVDPMLIAIGERGLRQRLHQLYEAFLQLELAKFNDGLAEMESRFKALGALEAEGLVSGFDAAKERVKLLTDQIEKATILTNAGVIIDPDKVADLKERLKEATQELRNFYLAGLLLRAIQGFANQIADAFRQAKEEGRRFGEVLKESLQRTFRELIAKLIVLTSLFLLLSVLSGGTGAIAGVARSAISGGFGSFIGEGLIGGGPGIRNLGITGGGGGTTTPSLRVEGFLSGNNVVIANQRGTRAIDRTFG